MNHDERAAIIERHCVQLREHFTSVHIVAVRHESDEEGTARFSIGKGSWYERLGAMAEFAARERAKEPRRAEIQVEGEGYEP